MSKLTPTSYALLGLLSLRPWSAYELNQHMQISILRSIWPRATSHIYSEPKQLLKQGLVTAAEEQQGARSRTVYRITAKGRRALEDWLVTAGARPIHLESEALLKFLYRSLADRPGAGAQELLDDSLATVAIARRVASQILEQGLPFPSYKAELAELLHLVVDELELRIRWARHQLAGPTETAPEQRYQAAVERLASLESGD